jgi:hypothetical protein
MQYELFSIEINSPYEPLIKIINENLDSSLMEWKIILPDTGNTQFSFSTTDDSAEVGRLVAKSISEVSTELIAYVSQEKLEEDINKDRFNIFRKVIDNLFKILKKEKCLITGDQLIYPIYRLNMPITQSEINENGQNKSILLENKKEAGYFSQTLLTGKFRTNISNFDKVLKDYRIQRLGENYKFWTKITFHEVRTEDKLISYEFTYTKFGSFGFIGKLDLIPLNKKNLLIRLSNASDYPSFIPENEGKELYIEALSELNLLAAYIKQVFDENLDGSISNLLKSTKSNDQILSKRKRYTRLDTQGKLINLLEIRRSSIKDKKIIGWMAGCQLAGIDSKTVNKSCPEIHRNWTNEKWKDHELMEKLKNSEYSENSENSELL